MLAFRSADPVVRTEPYDGPLDLLLYLVRRDSLDVRNLPLAHITREYLAFLDRLRDLDLDVAGEYLMMAATLCELKSRELLPASPRADEDEEEEDPREALARQLIEYQRYREAAQGLEQRPWLGRDVFRRHPEHQATPPDAVPLDPGVNVFGLLEAYHAALVRQERPPPTHEVQREPMRWQDCIRWVLHRLDDQAPHTLDELMAALPLRSARVFGFLAVLELSRLGLVSFEQREHLSPVRLQARTRAADADLSLVMEAP